VAIGQLPPPLPPLGRPPVPSCVARALTAGTPLAPDGTTFGGIHRPPAVGQCSRGVGRAASRHGIATGHAFTFTSPLASRVSRSRSRARRAHPASSAITAMMQSIVERIVMPRSRSFR
jgi:hypothetical protein